MLVLPTPGEPTPAQAEAGNYAKRKVQWHGLTISIENEAGSMRRGVSRTGVAWETRVPYPYGYVNRTMGVDGDEVDIYMGPTVDAPMVYVVHQRCYGDWDRWDEDKVMADFDCEESARQAFLACYDDPRFLGDVTAMPVAEFVAKVRATAKEPAMIKGLPTVALVLLCKAHVRGYVRGDGVVVRAHEDRRSSAGVAEMPISERSSSSATAWGDHRAVAAQISQFISGGDFEHFGLRVNHTGHVAKVGDILDNSVRWDDGVQTEDELSGTSTIEVTDKSIDRSIGAINKNGYASLGDQVVLVGGDDGGWGEDDGERLVRHATVLAAWNIPQK